MDAETLYQRIRNDLLREVHLGHREPGDRLPGIRRTVRRTGFGGRVVSRTFERLAGEGLVEIRARSGIYVAAMSDPADGGTGAVDPWLADVMLEAWRRRIPAERVWPLVAADASVARPRCAVVESIRDVRERAAHELRHRFGLEAVTLDPGRLADGTIPDRASATLRSVDFVLTTVFHMPALRAGARQDRPPTVLLSLHPDRVAELGRRLAAGTLSVVCLDERLGDRLRFIGDGVGNASVRVRTVSGPADGGSAAGPRATKDGWVTWAAARALGDGTRQRSAAGPPIFSVPTARGIIAHTLRSLDTPTALHDH